MQADSSVGVRHLTIGKVLLGRLVNVEVYDPNSARVDGYYVNVSLLRRWINQHRPCWVYRSNRRYFLPQNNG